MNYLIDFGFWVCAWHRLFKECPHPDDKQRLKLSQELGLKPRQVKFWFQNRRTQMKVRTLAAFAPSPSRFDPFFSFNYLKVTLKDELAS